jgi:hypothetical protein
VGLWKDDVAEESSEWLDIEKNEGILHFLDFSTMQHGVGRLEMQI